MTSIYELVVSESRESFSRLENSVNSLNSNALGMMSANALLFSVYTYIYPHPTSILHLMPSLLAFISFILLLICVWPREFNRTSADDIVKELGTMNVDEAQANMAVVYIDLEKTSQEKYNKKFKFYMIALRMTAVSIFMQLILVTCPIVYLHLS